MEERLKLTPDDARAVSYGANALVSRGETPTGLEWARRALEMDPEGPMLLHSVGCIKSFSGLIDEAIDCLERAVSQALSQKEWFRMDGNLDPLRAHPPPRDAHEKDRAGCFTVRIRRECLGERPGRT